VEGPGPIRLQGSATADVSATPDGSAAPEAAAAYAPVRPGSPVPEENAAILGWSPEIRLAQSLADILEYHRVGREGRVL
jgi:hypothetical protein